MESLADFLSGGRKYVGEPSDEGLPIGCPEWLARCYRLAPVADRHAANRLVLALRPLPVVLDAFSRHPKAVAGIQARILTVSAHRKRASVASMRASEAAKRAFGLMAETVSAHSSAHGETLSPLSAHSSAHGEARIKRQARIDRAAKGGRACREALTSEQRSESARRAAQARWKK